MIPIKQLIKQGGKWASKHSTEILTVVASLGVVSTGYFGVKAGMKLQIDLQSGEEDKSKKEIAVDVLKDTWPVLTSGGLTIAAIISSGIISKRKYKALATSYAILSEASETYRRKVVEQLGEKKHDEIMGEAAKEEFKDFNDDIQVTDTPGGSYLFKDGLTKQYLRSSADYVRKMQNKVNGFYTQGEDFVESSTWLAYLGLEAPCETYGRLGFPAASGVDFDLDSTIAPNGEPAYYIRYNVEPMTEEDAALYDMNHQVERSYI